MRTWIIAIIALIVGGLIGYYYEKNQVDTLSEQIATFKAQVEQEMAKSKDAGAQVEQLKADLEAKAKEVEDYVAKITDLESKQAPAQPDAQKPAAQ
jgi:chromosome segregation ATPase